jgi:hypothetical protein
MIMRHYWGLGVGHTYARISAAAAHSLYPKASHSANEHNVEEATGELPEDIDEEAELGDDDMVYVEDRDWDSDESSVYGLEDAELAARDDMYDPSS